MTRIRTKKTGFDVGYDYAEFLYATQPPEDISVPDENDPIPDCDYVSMRDAGIDPTGYWAGFRAYQDTREVTP